MAIYKDEVTGQSYDDESSDTLESAKASKLKYLQNAGQTATLGGVDQRASPTPAQATPSPTSTPPVDPYQNTARVLTGQPSLVQPSPAMAKGGEVKKGSFRKDLNAHVSDEDYAKHQASMSQAQQIISQANALKAQRAHQLAARQAAVQRSIIPQAPAMWAGGSSGGPASMSDGSNGEVLIGNPPPDREPAFARSQQEKDAESEEITAREDERKFEQEEEAKATQEALEKMKRDAEPQTYASGGEVKKRYPKHPPVNSPAQVPGIQLQQQMDSKKDALKKFKK